MKSYKQILFALLIVLNINSIIVGQKETVVFEHISLKDGLSQSTVYSILQDSKGFFWFGTMDGLNKYNGIDFEIYRNDFNDSLSLPSNTVNCLLETEGRYIWVGTENGLARFDQEYEVFKNYARDAFDNTTISDNTIRDIFQDHNGDIWIATKNGLNKYSKEEDNFRRFGVEKASGDLPHKNIWCISQGATDELWLGTSKGFCRFNIEKGYVVAKYDPNKLENNQESDLIIVNKKRSIRSIYADHNNVWLGTNGAGLYRFDVNSGNLKQYVNDISDNVSIGNDRVRAIYKDVEGELWFGSYSGLNKYNVEADGFYNYQFIPEDLASLSNNKVISIANDNLGQLWIGTFGGGLNKVNLKGGKFKLIRKKPYIEQTISSNIVLSICEGTDSLLWIGTDKGLDSYDLATNEYIHYKDSKHGYLSDKVVYAIIEDNNKDIWVGTAEGYLNKLNRKTGRFEKYSLSIMDYKKQIHYGIRTIFEDSYGKIWVGTHNGLFDFNKENGEYVHYKFHPEDQKSLGSDIVWAIFEDSESNLWVGTNGGGLNRFDRANKEFTRYWSNPIDSTTISNDIVRCIAETDENTLWVATSNGLNKFNKKTKFFKSYTDLDGLSNNLIYSLVFDGKYLWISTNKGINRLDPSNDEIVTYDISDGLQSNEFNQGAFYKSKISKRIYFGGIGGLNFFLPHDVISDTTPPKVYFTEFSLLSSAKAQKKNNYNEKALTYTDKVSLAYNENSFVVGYVGLHYYKPKSNVYKYKMEGLEENWVFANNRRYITYSNLPPGKYQLLVKAANSDGVWSKKPARLEVVILPPFWQTTWFYILIVIFSISAIYLFIRLRMKRVNWEKNVLAQKVKERTLEVEQQNEEISSQRDSMQALVAKLKQRNEEIESQRDQIEIKNNKLMDSIIYAQRIQKAILPSIEYVNKLMPNSFTLFLPKDIVSGDFYWVEQKGEKLMFAAVDCTGHGVPGALMSVIAYDILNQAINEHGLTLPADILNFVHASLNLTLLTDDDTKVKEGMDIAFCSFNRKTMLLEYAGAFNPLYIIREGKLLEFKADYMPIVVSSRYEQQLIRFTSNEIKVEKNDMLYIFTDGYVDQFGGERRKKFLRKRFKELLLRINHLSMSEQREELYKVFSDWKRDVEQIDDVLVMGFKI